MNSALPHCQGIEVGPLLLLLQADLVDATLQRLAQVQHLGVAGQDLGEHDENVPDVGVLARLQAVDRGLGGERRGRGERGEREGGERGGASGCVKTLQTNTGLNLLTTVFSRGGEVNIWPPQARHE